jgi:predicted phage baseplate assembly protein
MPLPPPVLDDRTYLQLRDELIRRIEVYTPEWTDHSDTDPGITLLELVAFLGENLLYRFNQIPDQTRLWLLGLLNMAMRPAQPARGLIAFTTEDLRGVGVDKRTKVRAETIEFEVEQDTTVLPVAVSAVIKAPAPAPADPDLIAAARVALDARGLAEGETAVYYTPVVLNPDPTAPGAERLDVPSAVDHALWIAVTAPDPDSAADLLRVDGPLDGAWLNLGFALDPEVPQLSDIEPCEGEVAAAPGPQLEWQISTVDETADGEPVYVPVTTVDTTRGMRHDGVVRVGLPAGLPSIGVPEPDADADGTGDLPPPLATDVTVLFWLRAFPATGTPEIPPLRWAGANAAEIVQAVTARQEFLGTGTGMPGQRYVLAHRAVLVEPPSDAPRVEVEEGSRWVPWTAVDSFAASTGEDRHYVLDPEAGTVTFGDSVRGRAPQLGERIRVPSYRYGGGEEGNVAAGGVTVVDVTGVAVTNPLGLGGGAPAETAEAALERIPGEFRRHDRAVTSGDFAEIALGTPGGRVGRADCLPRFHPPTLTQEAAGVVTVVVWPRHDPAHPDAPRPDRALLGQVCACLDERRLITTELCVVPPTYRRVAISVGLAVKPGFSADAVRRWVELVLRQYLAPLPPYGPEGRGWPLGRRVHGPELEAAALQVDGVEFLNGLDVAEIADDGTVTPGTVLLRPWEVAEVASIATAAGDVPPVGAAPPAPTPDDGGTPVPIPVPGEEC